MKFFLFLATIVFSFNSFSQLNAVKSKTSYNFWINLPEKDLMDYKPPILIFLHGKSLSGTDLNKVKKYGVIHEIENGREIPAIVIAPQVVSGSWDPDKILEVLQYVQSIYETDSSRIYVCGMSLGGYGTMHFAGKYPNIVAAGVALCGGGSINEACNLSTIPFWIQHGTADKAVPISESRLMVKAIRNCKSEKNLVYTEIKGANHADLEKVFRSNEMYDWMFDKIK